MENPDEDMLCSHQDMKCLHENTMCPDDVFGWFLAKMLYVFT